MASRRVLLVGMMGVGKTTIGRRLAERLGWRHLDSDEQVRAGTGMTVPEIFATAGEAAFRAEEARALAEAVSSPDPVVVSVAGGAVLDPENRRRLADAGLVVWLRADPAVLARRVGTGAGRPLLGDDPESALRRLYPQRRPFYEELADVVVDVDRLTPDQAVRRIVEALGVITVPVTLGERSYDVLVGHGARHRLLEVLPAGARRAAIVTQEGIGWRVDPAIEHETFVIDDGEAAKCLETIEDLCRHFARFGLTRRDVVVAVGGGVVTDTAGFAAAVYHRGVAVVHVATTLLAQVDAAIGGKTGVNLAEGKNLVGAFWQPAGVLCDTETLTTLPPREYLSGCGEMAKYHFLGGAGLEDLPLDERVAACVRIKAAVVASDERESGRRAILNYGHTLAHALETAGGYDLRHGEAVAIGLVFAARLARRLGRVDDDAVERHLAVVRGYGLPEALPAGVEPSSLLPLMARDKKALDGLTFALDGPRGVEVVPGVARADVEAVLKELAG